MQISRHWRMNPQRYRLQGVRYENGTVSLQSRPIMSEAITQEQKVELMPKQVILKEKVGAA